jgi:methylated-DNA-protein-cysteine methyltransferase-like protein
VTDFEESVYALVRRIPRGRVVSYGAIAAMLGKPRAARGVGRALRDLPDPEGIPWWRVLNRNGEISIPPIDHARRLQRVLLEGEGVEFDARGRVDWRRFGWGGEGAVGGEDRGAADGQGRGEATGAEVAGIASGAAATADTVRAGSGTGARDVASGVTPPRRRR